MGGSQFEPTEHHSNEQCGKSKHLSDGEDTSTVTNYKFLVALNANDSYTNEEINKRISLSKPAMEKFVKNHKRLGSFNQHKS